MSSIFRGPLPSVRWGAIFAGALVALAVYMVLMMFGTAIGISAAPADSRGLGVGGAVWGVLTPLVAYFCGAYVATRVAGALKPGAAHLHGVVTWGMGIVMSGVLMAGVLGGVMSGAMSGAGAASGRGTALDDNQADSAAGRAAAAAGMLGVSGVLGLVGALVGAAAGRNAVVDRGEAYHARIEREPREAQGMAMGMSERRGSLAASAPGMPERRRGPPPASTGMPERRRADVPPGDRGEQGRDLPSREGRPAETTWHD